jgi:uncharacterized protein YwgA
MAKRQDIGWVSGEDVFITVTLEGSGSIASETYEMTVNDRYRGTVLVTRDMGAGITITDATARKLLVTIPSVDTALPAPNVYAWELWRTNSGLRGQEVYGDVTVRETGQPAS